MLHFRRCLEKNNACCKVFPIARTIVSSSLSLGLLSHNALPLSTISCRIVSALFVFLSKFYSMMCTKARRVNMLAHRITKLRIERGITQSQLAMLLHISPSTIGMYEQGRRTPSIDVLIALSRTFSVSLDYLITGTDYLYADTTSRLTRITKNCPCSTCYWKNNNK